MDKWEAYFLDIGLTKAARGRVEIAFESAKLICQDEIVDIFITEVVADNGFREYLNVWFISNRFLMESKNFMTQEVIDVMQYIEAIQYIELSADNYNYLAASDDSRLSMRFQTGITLGGQFISTGKNCEYLFNIYKKYFMMNIR